jgi:hypothetical protein
MEIICLSDNRGFIQHFKYKGFVGLTPTVSNQQRFIGRILFQLRRSCIIVENENQGSPQQPSMGCTIDKGLEHLIKF